ncbi:MAG: hypothetical protein DYG83_14855 [Candidatus Brocadia sp. AMX2]|nr:MAG: hypothetical protein EDM70_12200 [Candidatus Brocadia sp. AMX2]MBC6933732.1 hypothetical protein [Candidatus Brocadia sp.]MBL1168760.1 hypothetical protein [Candidatus Brocadia sp. AMX1]MCE7868071.1 hypothetical protein [Candidatus Brocadia sp. AMX2]MCQ3918856.1 hypothetical protein [Candidatus Brocadia sp.]
MNFCLIYSNIALCISIKKLLRLDLPIYFSADNFYSPNNINVLQGKRQIVLENGIDFANLPQYEQIILRTKEEELCWFKRSRLFRRSSLKVCFSILPV